MNYDKIKKVNDELSRFKTITEKLDHWKTNYLEKYKGQLKVYFELKTKEEKSTDFNDALSGELLLPTDGSDLIHELREPSYAVPSKQRIEYYHWMINFLAEKMFHEDYKPHYENELKKPLGIQIIRGEYEKLKKIQDKALGQLQKGEINLYSNENLTPEKLFLWWRNDYYSQIEIRTDSKEDSHVRNICKHKFVFPYLSDTLNQNIKPKTGVKPGILKLTGINILKLVAELSKRNYFDNNDTTKIENWFKGIPLKERIQLNKPMNHFASLIASLQEANYIKNTKVICRELIYKSFLFHNETVSQDSIRNVMKKNSSGRITKSDKINFIDIQQFVEKN